MNRALKTGHRVLTTWHAMDGPDAIDRAATELSTKGGNILDYARSLASSFDIIVSQQKLGDGTRHVMGIEELTGVLVDGHAETRKLFEFHLTGEADKDPETGKVKKIYGYYQQLNPISEKLIQLFYSVGVTKEELDEFINIPEKLEDRSNLPSQKEIEERRLHRFDTVEAQKQEDELGMLTDIPVGTSSMTVNDDSDDSDDELNSILNI